MQAEDYKWHGIVAIAQASMGSRAVNERLICDHSCVVIGNLGRISVCLVREKVLILVL